MEVPETALEKDTDIDHLTEAEITEETALKICAITVGRRVTGKYPISKLKILCL